MNKKELVGLLIEQGELSISEIAEQADAKEVYVKSQFTKKGMDWREYSPKEAGLEIEEVEEVEEVDEPIAEILEDLASTDHLDPEVARMVYEGRELVQKGREANKVGRRYHLTKVFFDIADKVFNDLDFSPTNQVQLNCRQTLLPQRPAKVGTYKEVYEVNMKVRELFKYYFKHCHGK